MSTVVPLASLSVGVVVERTKGASQWVDFHWRPVRVLLGVPDTAPWTKLSEDGDRVAFYAGAASVELYRTETTHYRDNLQMDPPLLWVILRPVDADPPYELAAVTADPAEGEGMTEAGANIVESVADARTLARSHCGFHRRTPCRPDFRESANATARIPNPWDGVCLHCGKMANERARQFLEPLVPAQARGKGGACGRSAPRGQTSADDGARYRLNRQFPSLHSRHHRISM